MKEQDRSLANPEDVIIQSLRAELDKAEPSKRSRILEKFFLAALGAIPGLGES